MYVHVNLTARLFSSDSCLILYIPIFLEDSLCWIKEIEDAFKKQQNKPIANGLKIIFKYNVILIFFIHSDFVFLL